MSSVDIVDRIIGEIDPDKVQCWRCKRFKDKKDLILYDPLNESFECFTDSQCEKIFRELALRPPNED